MIPLAPPAIGIVGFVTGLAIGAAVWRAKLCSFGAIEDGLMGHDWRRAKVFGLALTIALVATQVLVLTRTFDPVLSTYIPDKLAFLPIGLGAVLFGFGMAMVGTCAFGSLVRLGGGDLRSLIVLIIFGATAYAMQRGILAPVRIAAMEKLAIAMPGMTPGTFPDLMAYAGLPGMRLLLASMTSIFLLYLIFSDRRLRRARRLLTAGTLLGAGVVVGWLATQTFADPLDAAFRTQSLTFVAPVGRSLFGTLLDTVNLSDFGVGSVLGVVFGAFLAAYGADEFRWNAFDDALEMRRHLSGAVLMGVGGVLAGGCTIGQGLTAGSLMALTWPLSVGGMIIGARTRHSPACRRTLARYPWPQHGLECQTIQRLMQ